MSLGKLSRASGAAGILLAICCLGPGRAPACATLEDQAAPVVNYITAERAVIIWDQPHHLEHFIRQASILTQSPDVGFLVPTPQMPELAEVSPGIFDMAAFLGQPKRIAPTIYQSPWTLVSPLVRSPLLHVDWLRPGTLLAGINQLRSSRIMPKVLGEGDVAGYHATILAAEDEPSLSAWLAANGYLSTPELKAWLKPYIAARWKITAFRLIKDNDTPILTTRAVRLSFRTDRPFYPYSEPSDRQLASAASPQGRALRVAILSNQRMTGALANNKPWPEKLEFAGPSTPLPSTGAWSAKQWLTTANLDDGHHDTLLPTTLTTFIDESNPRPGTADLYFFPDRDQTSFRGEAVDFTYAPEDRLVLSHSFKDVSALLTLILLPAVPLYCGWKMMKLPSKAELNPRGVRRIQPVLTQSAAPTLRAQLMRVADRLAGALAIVLGVYYGAQFTMLFAGEIASAFLGWSDIKGSWIWTLLGLLLALVPVLAMSWGVVVCGVNVWCARLPGASPRRNNPFYVEGERQGFMGVFSLLAGLIALLAVVSVVYPLL